MGNERKKWEQSEKEKLIELYPNTRTEKIAEILNRSFRSITCAANRFKLKRSTEFEDKVYEAKKELVTKRNKTVGRDLNVELLAEIAKKFKSRVDFQNNDSSAYHSARRLGILDQICSHMTKRSFSKPQMILRNILDGLFKSKSLYNDRKIIKPYEIDIFYPEFNLAIEYQGRYWHKFQNNENDIIKEKLFKDRGINVIYFHEKSRNYEKEIKEEIIEKLAQICELTGLNVSVDEVKNAIIGEIEYVIYNKEEAFRVAKTYSTRKEFKEKEPHSFKCLSKMGCLKEATRHMRDVRNHFRTTEEMLGIISKYSNLGDFIENEIKLYGHIKRNKLEHLLKNLPYKRRIFKFELEEIKNKIKEYEYKYIFKEENPEMFRFIKSNKLQYLYANLKNKPIKSFYTDEEVIETIKKYRRKCDFKNENIKMYNSLMSRKMLHLISHLIDCRFAD